MPTVTSKDGTTIGYEKHGNGPPLVLVDGALCSRQFGPSRVLAKHLAQDFTVFFYDRRGRGEQRHAAIRARAGGKIRTIDGPFAESKELVGGYALVNLPTREGALALAEHYAAVVDAEEVEVRQVVEPK